MAFRECWCQNWATLAASNKQTIFINRFSRVDWLHLWCLSAGIPFIPKLQVSTKPWLDVDIYLHTVNSAKSLKHKIKKTNSSIVSMLILAPPCSMFQAWSQLHSTSSVDTKLLHLTTFQHLLLHTAAKHWGEGAKVCSLMHDMLNIPDTDLLLSLLHYLSCCFLWLVSSSLSRELQET